MPLEPRLPELTFAALTLSAVHAALPTHWLPFVLVGRAERWNRPQVLGVVCLAGAGHVTATVALGLAAAGLGKWVLAYLPDAGRLSFSTGVLMAMGLIYLGLGLTGAGHSAMLCRADADHTHCEDGAIPRKRLRRGPVLALMAMLTLSPCGAIVPVYLAASPLGWWRIGVLSAVMSVATLGAMLLFTSLALAGMDHLRFRWLDRNLLPLTGVFLVLLGVVGALVGEHHFHELVGHP